MATFWGNFGKNWITFLFQYLVAVNFQATATYQASVPISGFILQQLSGPINLNTFYIKTT